MSGSLLLVITLGPLVAAGLGYWLGSERSWVKGYAAGMTAAYEIQERAGR